MKYSLLFYFFLVFSTTTLLSQSTLDNLIFEDAKEAYAKQNYKYCLQKIDELNQRGVKGLLILHLKIVATNKIAPAHLNDEMIVQFKKDVEYYLKNYDNEDFLQQYKEVYEVSKTLNETDSKMIYQRIKATFDLVGGSSFLIPENYFESFEDLQQFHNDINLYITNYAIEGLEDKYREIYKIQEDVEGIASSKFPKSETEYYYQKGYYLSHKDEQAATRFYKKAVEKGEKNKEEYYLSLLKLSEFYMNRQQLNEAIEYSSMGAQPYGFKIFHYYLGMLFDKVGKFKEAEVHFIKAVAEYDEDNFKKITYTGTDNYFKGKMNEVSKVGIYFKLGMYYEEGNSVIEKNLNKAIEYYTKAAQQGNKQAQVALKRLGKTW